MPSYAASQVRELLARGPAEDEDFYRLKVIGELFRRDPEAIIGQYKSVEDFRRQCREAQEWRGRYTEIVGHEPRSTMGADISFLELVEEVTA